MSLFSDLDLNKENEVIQDLAKEAQLELARRNVIQAIKSLSDLLGTIEIDDLRRAKIETWFKQILDWATSNS